MTDKLFQYFLKLFWASPWSEIRTSLKTTYFNEKHSNTVLKRRRFFRINYVDNPYPPLAVVCEVVFTTLFLTFIRFLRRGAGIQKILVRLRGAVDIVVDSSSS